MLRRSLETADYRIDSGVSEYKNSETLPKFNAWVDADDDAVYVDEFEIRAWEQDNPQPYNRDSYQGLYADVHGTPEEPHNHYVQGGVFASLGRRRRN